MANRTRTQQLTFALFCLLSTALFSCIVGYDGRFARLLDRILIRSALAAPEDPKPPAPEQKPEPALKVAGKFTGLNETEGIKLSSNTSDFRYAFLIEATEAKEVKDFRVVVYPFVGPDLAQVDTQWKVNGEPGDKAVVTVQGLQAIPLEITVQLPLAGEYKSSISLIYNNRRWPIPIAITRTRPALSIEVLKIETINDVSIDRRKDASIRFTIQEKEGRKVILDKPTLTDLSLVLPNKSKAQADFTQVAVQDESGNEIISKLALGPRETKTLKLIVGGLRGPGEFSGNLRVSSADNEPVNQALTILRKKHWIIAGGFIFAGVLISYLLRRYTTTARPRLVRQRRVLALINDVDELERTSSALMNNEKSILKEFRGRLRSLYEEIAMATDSKADDKLQEINRKLNLFPIWVQERERVDSLQPEELQREFHDQLELVQKYFGKREATSEDDVAAAKILTDIPSGMRKKVKEDLAAHLKSFTEEVNAQRQATKSDDVRNRLSVEVDPQIATALEHVTNDQLDKTRKAYDKARLAYARILAADLASSIPATKPLGFGESDWAKFKSEMTDLITRVTLAEDAGKAILLYQSAFATYLRNLIWKLQNEIDKLRNKIPSDSHLTPEQRIAHEATLVDLKKKLTDALSKIDAGKLRDAAADYEATRMALVTLNKTLPGGSPMGAAAGAAAAAAAESAAGGAVPEAFDLPFLGAALSRSGVDLPSLGDITKRLSWNDFLVAAVVLLAAVLFGLKLLWYDSPTWGTWNDYLTSVLWGLGLHQISGVATQGVSDIAAKLAPKAS